MSNVSINWTFGPVGANQKLIKETVLKSRSDPTTAFMEVARVAAPGTSFLIQDVPAGTWEYQGAAVDVDGKQGPLSSASVTVPSTTLDAPSALATFTAGLV